MSDLEEMGLIIQPHASAGRIPSDKGYRYYVDSILQKDLITADDQDFIKDVVNRNISQIEYLMEETARALSSLTNYTTFISDAGNKKNHSETGKACSH